MFSIIPSEYLSQIASIEDELIQSVYKFDFNFFYICQDKYDEKEINKILIPLKNFKFMTYEVSKEPIIKTNFYNIENFNIKFCSENNYYIIQNINESLTKMIINKLEESSVSLINYSKDNKNNFFTDNKNFDAIDEATSFIEYYRKKIENIQFIKNTLKILAGYLIRRFYCPSDFFNNQSFFSFDENEEDSFENYFKKNYTNLHKSECINENKIQSFLFNTFNHCINTKYIDHQNQYNTYEFHEDEFIYLRNIYQNKIFVYNLYFHKKKQYIFAIKLIYEQYENQYEKKFC